MTISAVNRYPLAKAKSAREPRIENCANSRAAVISSVTKTMASKDGNSAFNSTNGLPANGAVKPNPTSAATATARADQLCRAVGGNSASHLYGWFICVRAMAFRNEDLLG